MMLLSSSIIDQYVGDVSNALCMVAHMSAKSNLGLPSWWGAEVEIFILRWNISTFNVGELPADIAKPPILDKAGYSAPGVSS